MKLGSHVSLKAPDFLLGSISEAKGYGADCLMFYTGAPQNTIRVQLEKMKIEEANRFDSDLIRVCHAPYVLNLASPDDSKRAFAISFLQEEANRAFRLGARCLVLHPGSALGQSFEDAARRVAMGLDSLSLPIPIALETMAGKGSEIGKSLDEIAYLLSSSKQDLRVCLDTCHLSDAGYDLSDPDAFIAELERFFPLEKVAVIHLNDSKTRVAPIRTATRTSAMGRSDLRPYTELRAIPGCRRSPSSSKPPISRARPLMGWRLPCSGLGNSPVGVKARRFPFPSRERGPRL